MRSDANSSLGSKQILDIQGIFRSNKVLIIGLMLYYLLLVIYLQKYFKIHKGYKLRKLTIVYNALHSLFSACVGYLVFKKFINIFVKSGLKATYCTTNYYYVYPWDICNFLFVFSKYIELFDTFLLLFKGKKVIFLHWYHHITVIYMSTNNFISFNPLPSGLYVTTTNLTAHFLMYAYYALVLTRVRQYILKFSIIITTLQLLQMFIMIAVNGAIIYEHYNENSNCNFGYMSDLIITGTIYSSYAVLFGIYFINRYYRGESHKKTE